MQVRDLGEFALIDRIARFLPAQPADVVVGIGDDVAVLQNPGSDYLLATCDIQVEGTHFNRNHITAYQLGRKTAAINLSDIAAMGGTPSWALVSLALPEETEVVFVDDLYRGLQDEMLEAGAAIVGGNLSRMQTQVVIDFFLIGKVAPEHMVRRSGARLGDLILVTGTPGDSRAGLELLRQEGLNVSEESSRRVLQAHLTPRPRLREGRALGRSQKVHAMVDVSDGLLSDLQHICQASGVGAEIWLTKLPLSGACKEVAGAAGKNALDWGLAGGEDYELLFATSPQGAAALQEMLADETGTPCAVIGCVVEETQAIQVCLEDGTKSSYSPQAAGWNHFRRT